MTKNNCINWREESCEENVVIDQDYILVEDGFNTITANSVQIENFTLHEDEILIINCTEAIIVNDFIQEEGSYFEVNIVDGINCNKSAQYIEGQGIDEIDNNSKLIDGSGFDSEIYIQNFSTFEKIEIACNSVIKEIKVFNQLGELVYISNSQFSNVVTINYSTFPTGLYLVKVLDVNNVSHVTKIVVP